jgi:hypothetical protein
MCRWSRQPGAVLPPCWAVVPPDDVQHTAICRPPAIAGRVWSLAMKRPITSRSAGRPSLHLVRRSELGRRSSAGRSVDREDAGPVHEPLVRGPPFLIPLAGSNRSRARQR